MVRSRYSLEDFLSEALQIITESGPSAVTIGLITKRLGAPIGSFYHRFASRDLLLAELWLRLSDDFQRGVDSALAADDPLAAALHAAVWSRAHPDEAHALLLHQPQDFVQGQWPTARRDAAAAHNQRVRLAIGAFARLAFDQTGPEALRRARFLLVDVPVAALAPHLRSRERPPMIVDWLITTTYRAVAIEGRDHG